MSKDKAGVIGGGLMGLGIASVLCRNDHPVYLFEEQPHVQQTLVERMVGLLRDDGYSEEKVLNFHVVAKIEEIPKDLKIIFEAASEKLAIKQDIFKRLVAVVGSETILASNTSVIPITAIASVLEEGDRRRVIGTHWWNPANLIPLVEVVKTNFSDSDVAAYAYDLLLRVGKKPVYVEKDVAGFIGNRLQHALWREAHALISDGVCTPETIDVVVKNSFGMRLPVFGPIENADMVGLDLTLDIHNVVLSDLNNSTVPLPALLERVNNKKLGVKSGEGFLDWSDQKRAKVQKRLNMHIRNMLKIEQGDEDEK